MLALFGRKITDYSKLPDGIHKSNGESYMKYCNENDIYVSGNEDINRKTIVYAMKSKGYYGFFAEKPNASGLKDYYILNGDVAVKINDCKDVRYIENNFDSVIVSQNKSVARMFNMQQELSHELKEMGLQGTIHGCIVDIDYYHKIIINPVDCTLMFYYSFNKYFIHPFQSFNDVIDSLVRQSDAMAEKGRKMSMEYDFEKIRNEYCSLKESSVYLLGSKTSNSIIKENKVLPELDKCDYFSQTVDFTHFFVMNPDEGLCNISMRMQDIHKLFDKHILCSFDSDLIASTDNYIHIENEHDIQILKNRSSFVGNIM